MPEGGSLELAVPTIAAEPVAEIAAAVEDTIAEEVPAEVAAEEAPAEEAPAEAVAEQHPLKRPPSKP